MATVKKSTNGTSEKTAKLISAKAQSARPAKALTSQQLEQRIRERAYDIYLKRGGSQDACANQDWYEAEKQIKQELRLS